MDTKNLYFFQVVFEEGNIRTAAQKLYISPQGLGKIIKGIEQELDCQLFTRTKSGIIPTESGIFFYEKSRKLLQELQEIKRQIYKMNRGSDELQVGFASGSLKVIAFEELFRFINDHSHFRVSWSECENDKVLVQLENGTLDFGFVTSSRNNPNLEQIVVAKVPIVLLVYEDHPFWNLEKVSMDMLEKQDMVMMNEQFHIYYDFIQMCHIKGFEPHIRAKTMDGDTLYRLCKQKMGVAVCPDFSRTNYDGLKAIPFEEPYFWNIYGTWRKDYPNLEVIKMFIEFFRV